MSPPAIDYVSEYDNRARVPDHPEIIDRWARDATAYREARRSHAELGIAYDKHPRQFVDLFRADSPDPGRPMVVFIHGGYWRSLEPRSFSHMAGGMNRRGYDVAVLGYRICPEVKIGDIISDVRAAVAFLHRREKRRIVAAGHSAGGHLTASLVACDWQKLDPALPADLVRHGLAVSGVFDLVPIVHTPVNVEARMDETEAKSLSPAFWKIPPSVRLDARVGETESSEFHRQTKLVAERWAKAGATTSDGIVERANHFTAANSLSDPDSELTSTLAALAERTTR